jgi:hypothetical protein
MYKLRNLLTGGQDVIRLSDNAYIPFSEDNTDYQAFLKYQAEGGVVLPADEVTK